MSMRRPLPDLRPGDEPMWDGLGDGVLRLQMCRACGHVRYPPGPLCPRCVHDESSWQPMAGGAVVVSWVTFERQYFPGMVPPYVVVAGQLNEGPIVLADLEGPADGLVLDGRIRLVFGPATFEDGTSRPLFRWRLDAPPTSASEVP